MALLDFLTGGNAGSDEMERANKLLRENVARLQAIGIPTVEAQQIALESPELVGLLEAEQVEKSGFEDIQVDPRLRQAQMKALEEMAGLSETGLGTADKVAFEQLRREAASQAQANQKAILAQQAARGTLDSGGMLAAQLQAGQSQADRLSQEGDRLAAAAANARRDAIMQQANMSSNIRGQDYSQSADAAKARDLLAQFNAQNRQRVGETNLQNRQAIENQRVATANQQQIHNQALQQQYFQNQMQRAGAQAQATAGLAQNYANQGQAKAQGQANLTSGLIGTAATLGGAYLGGPMGAAAGQAVAGQVAPEQPLPTEDENNFFGQKNPYGNK